MVCCLSRINDKERHIINSIRGFDIHYRVFDELFCQSFLCGKEFVYEDTAWEYANTLADKNKDSFVDIYVVYSLNNLPVLNYKAKLILNLPCFK